MKKLLTISLVIILTMAFCFNLKSPIPKSRAQGGGDSRDVISPTTYITEDQAHARLFKYDNTNFTNISAANQNISPEVNAVAWSGTYWAMAARGRLWRYSGTGTTVTEVVTPDPSPTPADNIYPYAAIASNGAGAAGKWLAGTLMSGRSMYYNGADTPSAYNLANSTLTADVDADPATIILPVQVGEGARFKAGDVVQVGMEFCLVGSVLNDDLTVTRGYNSTPEPHSSTQEVKIAVADIVSVDWDVVNRWLVAGLTPDFSTHLFATSANNTSTDLGLIGVSQAKGDYRVGDHLYYLVGGTTVNGSASMLFSYDNNITFDDITDQIPLMAQSVSVITGGDTNWLVGGAGTKILYNISKPGADFTGTAITTPPELTSVTAIGYQSGNNWLIGGKNSAGKAKLYSYDENDFTDLTASMQTETQAAITTINSIVWNGSYWLIGGAGEFNVSPEVGGSVAAPDSEGNPGNNAKVAFTAGTVDHDSSVRVSETTGIATDSSLKSAGTVYNFTCQDLVSNNSVTQFDKSATINLRYDSTKLGDLPESSLSIYYYNEATSVWLPVSGGTIDSVNKTITADVNHFTKFGVFARSSLPYTGK